MGSFLKCTPYTKTSSFSVQIFPMQHKIIGVNLTFITQKKKTPHRVSFVLASCTNLDISVKTIY